MRYVHSLPVVIVIALTLAGTAISASPNVTGVVVGLAVTPACIPDEPCDPPARPMLGFSRLGTGGRLGTLSRVRIGVNGRFVATLAPGLTPSASCLPQPVSA